jgi:hypothetical protein
LQLRLQANFITDIIFRNILESYVLENIDFLNSNSILTEEQFGFRKGLSTDKAMYKSTDEILCALSDKMHVSGIFCDLAKALDCVNHDILVWKLNIYGIQGKAGLWFKSYCNVRK